MTPTLHRCLVDCSHGDPHVFGAHHSQPTISTLESMGCIRTSDTHLRVQEREYTITPIGDQCLWVLREGEG